MKVLSLAISHRWGAAAAFISLRADNWLMLMGINKIQCDTAVHGKWGGNTTGPTFAVLKYLLSTRPINSHIVSVDGPFTIMARLKAIILG